MTNDTSTSPLLEIRGIHDDGPKGGFAVVDGPGGLRQRELHQGFVGHRTSEGSNMTSVAGAFLTNSDSLANSMIDVIDA